MIPPVCNSMKAKRPSIPVLFWCACCLWAGCYVTFNIVPPEFTLLVVAISIIVGALFIVLVLVLRESRFSLGILLVLFFVLGSTVWSFSCLELESQRTSLLDLNGETLVFRIIEDPNEGNFGRSIMAEVRDPHSLKSLGKVSIALDDQNLNYGDEVLGKAGFSLPSESSLSYFNSKGITANCRLYHYDWVGPSRIGFLAQLRNDYIWHIAELEQKEYLSSESSALLKALVAGDRTDLFSMDLYQQIKVLGLAHLVAVSGSHLVIVMGFANLLLRSFRVPKRFSLGLQILFAFIYLIMVGFPISCLRAALMTSVSLFAYSQSRRSHALSGLGAVVMILLVIMPSSAFSLSFILSVFSTFGIILFMPLFSSWFKARGPFIRKWIRDPIALSLAALLCTTPFCIQSFSMISLIAPIANVFAGPFVVGACCLGVLAFVMMPVPFFCDLLLLICGYLLEAFCKGAHFLAQVPGASLPIFVAPEIGFGICFLIIAALWVFWPSRPTSRVLGCGAVIVLMAFIGLSVPDMSSRITMLDVGQGDAFVLSSGGKNLLVDTGNDPQMLYASLFRNRIFSLDAVIVSHADDDHCGCLSDLSGVVLCEKVYVADGIQDIGSDKTNDLMDMCARLVGEYNVGYLTAGDSITFGSMDLHIISPEQLRDEGGNQDSISFIVEIDENEDGAGDWKGFFGGDIEVDALSNLLDEGLLSQVDVLKVSHHGAKAALSDELIEVFLPKISLISVGADNRYGHPAQETLERLENSGSAVFRTDTQGDVVCRFDSDKISVSTLR